MGKTSHIAQKGIKKKMEMKKLRNKIIIYLFISIRIDYLFRQCIYCNIVFNYVSK